jgi:hypothetical protein
MKRQMSMRVVPSVRSVFGLGLLSLFSLFAQGQALRDPTQPPPTETNAAPGTTSAAPSVQPGSMAIVVRQGVLYLVVGTRLYANGQKVGQARIERISETEVWLREAGVVRKVQVFGGIQRQASKPGAAASRQSISSPSVAQSKP